MANGPVLHKVNCEPCLGFQLLPCPAPVVCGSRKLIHTPAMEGHWNFLGGGGGGGGFLKAKLLEEKYEAKMEFPGGEGVQNKKSRGRVWISSGSTQLREPGM